MTRDDIQKQALDATVGKRRVSVVLGTGVGKTLVGLNHIENTTTELMKCLIVAPKKAIFNSWIDDAKRFNKEHLLKRIVFSTYLSLNKHNPDDYNNVYLDEMHSLLSSHTLFLNKFKGVILGLTGTPPKYQNSIKGKIVDQYCPVAYTHKVDEAIENHIINDYQIIVHELYLSSAKNYENKSKYSTYLTSEHDNYNFWTNKIASGIGNIQMARIMRMRAFMEYSTKIEYTKLLFKSIKSKCILFANTQLQADSLCEHSYHSKNPDSEVNLALFKTGEITKLSTVHQLSEGVNIPELKQGIIMHCYGNERKFNQKLGRLVRLNPDDKAIVHVLCYMDTVDEKWCKEALSDLDQTKIIWKNFNL